MKPTLDALRRARRPGASVVDRFIAAHQFPLVDPAGVTFVWRGRADRVSLRTFAYGLPGSLPMARVGRTDLWSLRFELPPGSRLEYKFEVLRAGRGEWITDPLNPLQAADPFGANSVCRGHGYRRPEWTLGDRTLPAGTVESIRVRQPGADRAGTAKVWLPARFRRSRRYPLLVVHDGTDFMRYANLTEVLDQLSFHLQIPQLVVALHDPVERTAQYTASEDHAAWLTHALLPELQRRFPLDGAHGVLGASLGAVASLHAAWRFPQVWRHLALLSGSFAFSDIGPHGRDALFDPVVRFVNDFRRNPGPTDACWYVACGLYESLINENRALASLLAGRGYDVRYDEVPDGHHWECWRDRLANALGWLFAAPLWMVYE